MNHDLSRAVDIRESAGGLHQRNCERRSLGYIHADIVEEARTRIPLTRDAVGSDGTISDPAARELIAGTLAALARHVADRGSA